MFNYKYRVTFHKRMPEVMENLTKKYNKLWLCFENFNYLEKRIEI